MRHKASVSHLNFDKLVTSMREGGDLLHGSKKAARTWMVEGDKRIESKEDVQTLRQEDENDRCRIR